MKPRSLVFALAGALSLLAAVPAYAQQYPNKPIRVVVPFPPGNASDVTARAMSDKLQQRLGQTLIVDNRAGAQGNIGVDAVAKAAPDGYTILVTSLSPIVITPSVSKNTPYDPVRDLAPVAMIGYTGMILVASAQFPASNVKDLVAYIKANPGKTTYASLGSGTLSMLAMEMFKRASGVEALHVPYKGSSQALTDLLGGQVTLMIDGMTSSYGQVKAGKLKALAIASQQRSSFAPNIPTMRESGIPGLANFDIAGWVGVLAPAGTPKPIVERLNAELNQITQQPDFKERATAAGLELYPPATPDQFGTFIKGELARYRETSKALHIEAP
ncbi:MAG TPA: tripartite tricarboxylate transporter substrate binding protein [Burkholderiales bacterium]